MDKQRNIKRILLIILSLLAVYSFSIYIRSHIFSNVKKKDYSPFYNTEAAHYLRYAEMVSKGEEVPAIDYKAQYPEGFEVFKGTSIFMEYIVGYLHRLPFFRNIPFFRFVEYFNWYCSAISIFGIFLLCLLFVSDIKIALLSALYYAVAIAAISRTVDGFFEKEIFTLPVMIFHLFFFLKYLATKKRKYSFTAAVLLFIIMASFRLSQFDFLLVISYPVFKFLFSQKTEKFKGSLLDFFAFQLAALFAAGLIIPYLRCRLFIFSLPMIICYSFIVLLITDKYITLNIWKKVSAFFILNILLFIIFPQTKDYTSVTSMFFYKIRYFLQKPLDPARLPFLTRSIWVGPYKSPSLYNIIYLFSTYLFWGIASVVFLIMKFIKKQLDIKLEFLLFLTGAFLASYLFFKRLQIFLIIALSVNFAFCLHLAKKYLKRKLIFILVLVMFCLVFEWYKTWTYFELQPFFSGFLIKFKIEPDKSENRFVSDATIRMVEVVKTHTEENAKILTKYAFSAPILLYTGRTIFINPSQEKIAPVLKIREVSSALYQKERDFHDICKEYKVDYYVYAIDEYLDNSIYSTRYLVDKMDYNEEKTAYFMQFEPENLKYFKLVYQNEIFRIFKFIPQHSLQKDRADMKYYPCYDKAVYNKMGISHIEFLEKWISAYINRIAGDYYYNKQQFNRAEVVYNSCLNAFPFFPHVLINLARIYLISGNFNEAHLNFQRALSINYSASAHYGATMMHLMQGSRDKAEQELQEILKKEPFYLPAVIDLVNIYGQKRLYERAIDLCKKAIQRHPDSLLLYKELAVLYQKSGRHDLAQQVYEKIKEKSK